MARRAPTTVTARSAPERAERGRRRRGRSAPAGRPAAAAARPGRPRRGGRPPSSRRTRCSLRIVARRHRRDAREDAAAVVGRHRRGQLLVVEGEQLGRAPAGGAGDQPLDVARRRPAAARAAAGSRRRQRVRRGSCGLPAAQRERLEHLAPRRSARCRRGRPPSAPAAAPGRGRGR